MVAVAIGAGMNTVHPSSDYCPSPSPASVEALFAPCQAFDTAMGRSVTKQEAVQMGLLMPEEQTIPATRLAVR